MDTGKIDDMGKTKLILRYRSRNNRSMIDSREFAKYIIYKAGNNHSDINMTKLQKLLYICDGVMLSQGYNAIDENPKAWDYGPVYPKVYRWYKKRVGKPVERKEIAQSALEEIEENHFDTAIDKVFGTFGTWTANQLSAWTHKPNSPWSNAVENNGGEMYGTISKNDMRMYFSGMVKNGKN